MSKLAMELIRYKWAEKLEPKPNILNEVDFNVFMT